MPKSPPPGVVDQRFELQRALLAWYAQSCRLLPWRRAGDPYGVWVSEIMLQQTQAATVTPYFERWMERFPTIQTLAEADEGAVLAAWQGLGYYRRALSLHRAARMVCDEFGGQLPSTAADLLRLPGVGPYTAGAIASIAFGKREPAVDGNAVRVLSRLFLLRGDPAREPLATAIREKARSLLPDRHPGDFNQALMELGAIICRPGNPRCDLCPIEAECLARRAGVQSSLPEIAARPAPEQVEIGAALHLRGGAVLLVRRGPQSPRWAGLWSLPAADVGTAETPAERASDALGAIGLACRACERIAATRHAVTRYQVTTHLHRCVETERTEHYRAISPSWGTPAEIITELAWVAPADLSSFALPSAHLKLLRAWLADTPCG